MTCSARHRAVNLHIPLVGCAPSRRENSASALVQLALDVAHASDTLFTRLVPAINNHRKTFARGATSSRNWTGDRALESVAPALR